MRKQSSPALTSSCRRSGRVLPRGDEPMTQTPCRNQGCPGHYEQRRIAVIEYHAGQPIIVDNVPARVCDECGDELLAWATSATTGGARSTAASTRQIRAALSLSSQQRDSRLTSRRSGTRERGLSGQRSRGICAGWQVRLMWRCQPPSLSGHVAGFYRDRAFVALINRAAASYRLTGDAEGESRTRTPLRATVFETVVSAIPPLRPEQWRKPV